MIKSELLDYSDSNKKFLFKKLIKNILANLLRVREIKKKFFLITKIAKLGIHSVQNRIRSGLARQVSKINRRRVQRVARFVITVGADHCGFN